MNSEPKSTVVFKDSARTSLLEGIKIVADAVGCTLGPRGKTVIIQRYGEAPVVTKDGVTVSKAIHLKDPIPSLGCELIKQAAERTNEVAGDGTTTATVLTYAMVTEGNRMVANGTNAQLLCKGINIAVAAVVEKLRMNARTVKTTAEIAQVATISANGDAYIGDLIAKVMDKIGRDGIVTVEDAKGTNTSMEIVEGLQIDRGYLSPYFVNNADKMNVTYENVKVLITDKKLSELTPVLPILEQVVQSRTPLLIIADDVDGNALAGLVLNRVKGNLPVVAVKAPAFGLYRDDILSDLCTLTGAQLVSSKTGLSFEKLSLKDLGTLKKIIVDSKSSTLVNDGQSVAVEQRIKELQSQSTDVSLSTEEVSRLKMRIAGLTAGVAVVRVGGATELEMIERKHRIEDALHATKAASEEGIVPGGGMALMRAVKEVNQQLDLEGDQLLGAKIVMKACQAPLRRIVENANGVPDVILNSAENVDGNVGYDAVTETFRDMFDAGIVDPVKVCRSALQHAASVATTFLSLDAVIYQEVEHEKNAGF